MIASGGAYEPMTALTSSDSDELTVTATLSRRLECDSLATSIANIRDSTDWVTVLKAMCHTDVEAPMVINWFPYFLPTSLFFSSKRSRLLFSYLLPTITCFALSRRTNWYGEIRETVPLPWELQRRYATLP